ncbi:EAL domain-containing protein [Desulfovibrio cuneatus]|uniref:EAL domain-containing protein n=1 Tax=Desulfovibrio cuneatus TaxID=159728 RepID=UPI0004272F18|nr:bifunctional diguanylate cyclase/phosphodiesterase [Desulfovibrio cuneatus]
MIECTVFSPVIAFTWMFIFEVLSLGLIQVAAFIGIAAAVSVFCTTIITCERAGWQLGAIVGVAGYLLFWLNHYGNYVEGPVLHFLPYEALFIAALFAGWQSAGIAWAMGIVAHVVFAGWEEAGLVALDMGVVGLASLAVRRGISGKAMQLIHGREVFTLSILRVGIYALGPVAFWMFSLLPGKTVLHVILLRTLYCATILQVSLFFAARVFRREVARRKALFRDPLCLLPNRQELQLDLEVSKLKGGKAEEWEYATLLFISLGNIRALIQERGHAWADAWLQSMGHSLVALQAVPPWKGLQAKAYAYAEGSFVMLLRGITLEEAQAAGLGYRMLSKFTMEGAKLPGLAPHLSIGMVEIPLPCVGVAATFLRSLDMPEREYAANVYIIDKNFMNIVKKERYVRACIEEWIATEKVAMYFQPKVNLLTDTCIGAEGLLRLPSPEGKNSFVPPQQVLSVAMKSHLLEDLEWAIIKHMVQCLKILPPPLAHLQFSVNITPASLAKAHFGERLCTLLGVAGVNPRQLIVEIMETNQLSRSELVRENIEVLHTLGVQLALDDCGTGYGSLALLSQYRFGEMKIDYSMTSNMHDFLVFSAMQLSVETARLYGTDVVAEGVETKEQQQLLRHLGVTRGQGRLFGSAIPYAGFVCMQLQAEHGKAGKNRLECENVGKLGEQKLLLV